MRKYTNTTDINFRSNEYQEKTSIANAVRKDTIASKLVKEKDASHIPCHMCKAINTLDGDDLIDLNGKRHFCQGADRIRHEENCVIEIQKVIEYYNRKELSGFQVELNIQ
ncbi:MAG: hypothetical protein M3044_17535 [Thermoproteota archaeon]|nr:hypothetical protein [Thermoproteota archaeon]